MVRKHPMTLVEVVVSLAILALSLLPFLSLANASQQRILKAREKWVHFHMLSQAAEYLMLQEMEDPELPNEDFFDYPGYKIECNYEVVEDLPEELTELGGQAQLQCCTINLINAHTEEVVDSLKIDRINYDEITEN